MYEAVIGLEVHLHLKTRTKMFCGCRADYFGAEPNTHTCPVCLGLPGALPVPNRVAVEHGLRLALALGAEVPERLVFHRKNYFYPDLPKGYQISQYDLPLGRGGSLPLGERRVRIKRLHLEADAGKSLHLEGRTLLDLNRAGSPLIELVTEPDLKTPEEARLFLQRIQALVQTLGISDASPEEGKLRADVNVSVRRVGEPLGTKVEIKNLNSFKSVQRALEYEIRRQTEILRRGEKVKQATMGFEEGSGKTYPMRTKEEEADYRYFPDPDLLPVVLDAAFIEGIRALLPELPDEKAARFVREHGLSEYDAGVLTASRELAAYYEAVVRQVGGEAKLCANWVMGDLAAFLNKDGLEITASRVDAAGLAGLVGRIADATISGKIAKEVFEAMWASGQSADAIIEQKGLRQITDTGAIEKAIEEVMASNPGQLADYRSGKDKLFGFFVGQVMKATGGKANPAQLNELLKKKLAG